MKHQDLTEKLIGVFYEVYNELGYGFLESVYQKAYTMVLAEQGIPFEQQPAMCVRFRGVEIGEFRADLIVESLVILEFKAARMIENSHERQLYNYLRATDLEVGLLFNFGPRPVFRRLILENDRKLAKGAVAGFSPY